MCFSIKIYRPLGFVPRGDKAVLVFSVDENKKHIVIEDYDNNDKIYL